MERIAQGSSEAVKDITDLIKTPTGQVSQGVQLVRETGMARDAISKSVEVVAENIASIPSSSRKQAPGSTKPSNKMPFWPMKTRLARGPTAQAAHLSQLVSL